MVRILPYVMSAGAQLLIWHILSLKMESETLYQVNFCCCFCWSDVRFEDSAHRLSN